MPYDVYNEGAKYISYLLTPATVSLAIPLYEQFEALSETGITGYDLILHGLCRACADRNNLKQD